MPVEHSNSQHNRQPPKHNLNRQRQPSTHNKFSLCFKRNRYIRVRVVWNPKFRTNTRPHSNIEFSPRRILPCLHAYESEAHCSSQSSFEIFGIWISNLYPAASSNTSGKRRHRNTDLATKSRNLITAPATETPRPPATVADARHSKVAIGLGGGGAIARATASGDSPLFIM